MSKAKFSRITKKEIQMSESLFHYSFFKSSKLETVWSTFKNVENSVKPF